MKKVNLILLLILPFLLGAQEKIVDNSTLNLLRSELAKNSNQLSINEDLTELVITD